MAQTPTKTTAPLIKNSAAAPFIYFDAAPVYGHINGIIEIELSARIMQPKADGTVGVDVAAIAHLRCSPAAANSLVDALDKALDMLKSGNPTEH